MPSDTKYIYVLIDPQAASVRYVGQTVDPNTRLYFHRYKPRGRRPVEQWARGLAARGSGPEMVVIEETKNDDADRREIYWIGTLRAAGFRLLNLAEGGKTRRGASPDGTTRAKLADAARSAWSNPLTRAKYIEASRARWARPEEHEKLSAALSGKKRRPPSEETRRKIGQANSRKLTGRRLSPEHRDKAIRPLRERNRQQVAGRVHKSCGRCGASFMVAPWENRRKFCSPPCYWQSKRKTFDSR
jgi:hypothetical protein